MTDYDPRAAGNKGIPAPKEGYEQRRVAYRKYNDAYAKGWRIRNDNGVEYHGGDAILCERLFVGDINIDPISESITCANDGHFISSLPPIPVGQSFIVKNESDIPLKIYGTADILKYNANALYNIDVEPEGGDISMDYGIDASSPVGVVIQAIGDAATNALYGTSIVASPEVQIAQALRLGEIMVAVDSEISKPSKKGGDIK